MTVLTLCLVAGLLQTGTRGAQIAASEQTWQGFVTDTHCGTNCQATKDMNPDKKCIERCVRKGSKYGLWVEHHVYELEPQSQAAQYAAKDVSVTATLDGETIYIDSMKPSKLATAKKSDTNGVKIRTRGRTGASFRSAPDDRHQPLPIDLRLMST